MCLMYLTTNQRDKRREKTGGLHHPFITAWLACNDAKVSYALQRKRVRYPKCGV